jgi:hypothetical protein
VVNTKAVTSVVNTRRTARIVSVTPYVRDNKSFLSNSYF